MSISSLLRLWFSSEVPVRRLPYALSGLGLMALKYAIDSLLILRPAGITWTPFDYLTPLGVKSLWTLSEAPGPVLWVLVIWTLPFIWIGASMTVRRAVDAGLSPWVGLLFFVPFVNYFIMLWFCHLPSMIRGVALVNDDEPSPEAMPRGFAAGIYAGLLSIAVALAMMATSVFLLESYGVGLFIGTPFVMGFVGSLFFNRPHPRSLGATVAMSILSLTGLAGLLLLLALEGGLCLVMAFPFALLFVLLGAWIGCSTMSPGPPPRNSVGAMILLMPLLMGVEAIHNQSPLREVITAVDIDAPPEVVWERVIGFHQLPPPTHLVFRLGIAYPVRARLDGSGVGAIRHCEFSTGAFVEPITVWDPPRRLAFDVASQPEPLQEWSPYQTVHAPHLLDGFLSERGEFRLTALPGGRTRLEGSTWYRLGLFPQVYWGLFSDALIHSIHQRVLTFVRELSESDARS